MKKKSTLLLIIMAMILLLAACKNEKNAGSLYSDENTANEVNEAGEKKDEPFETASMELKYATQFTIDYLDEGYKCIKVSDGSNYILVPKGGQEKDFGIENPVFLPLESKAIYLAASSVMDLFMTLDSLDSIVACSTKSSDFNVEIIKEKIDSKTINYVGKYSSPDYEALLSLGCDMAIESTMITHAPKIKEQLSNISIPVFVDWSSYEESPLGRLEWIKVYAAMLNREKEAETFFNSQVEKLSAMEKELGAVRVNSAEESTKDDGISDETKDFPTVAFFYISSNGYVNVRKPGDYICKMLEIAGGSYALDSLMAESNALSTMNINWEDFYLLARNADIIIYNGTIDGGLENLQDLFDKNPLFEDFKAVKEGRVYGTSLNMYQESSKIIEVILEMNNVILNKNLTDNRFILPLETK